MDFSEIFKEYEALVSQVDKIFEAMESAHEDCVQCEVECCDCCHAVFDVTLIESAYINHHFNQSLGRRERRQIMRRAEKADRLFYQIKRKLHNMHVKEGKSADEVLSVLAEERVPCPLLNDDKRCDLYERRPLTCRVYGIPTSIGGKPHICKDSGFKEGVSYPTVNLDSLNDRLFGLSKKLLEEIGSRQPEIHIRLIPVSAALLTDHDEEYFVLKTKVSPDA